jgi:hypothetical protein
MDISSFMLQETYSKLSNNELLDIICHSSKYTSSALSLAHAELDKRSVSLDQRNTYSQYQAAIDALSPAYNIVDDLSLSQKVFFFVLWLPRIGGFSVSVNTRAKLSEKGHILKVWQSNYYAVLGFVAFIITLAIANNNSVAAMVIIWSLCFLVAYLFDRLYNLRRQRQKLRKLSGDKRLDLEW